MVTGGISEQEDSQCYITACKVYNLFPASITLSCLASLAIINGRTIMNRMGLILWSYLVTIWYTCVIVFTYMRHELWTDSKPPPQCAFWFCLTLHCFTIFNFSGHPDISCHGGYVYLRLNIDSAFSMQRIGYYIEHKQVIPRFAYSFFLMDTTTTFWTKRKRENTKCLS